MLIPSPSARVDIVAFLGIRMVIGSLAIARVSSPEVTKVVYPSLTGTLKSLDVSQFATRVSII